VSARGILVLQGGEDVNSQDTAGPADDQASAAEENDKRDGARR